MGIMRPYQIGLLSLVSTVLAMFLLGGLLFTLNLAQAAPAGQSQPETLEYVSVSGMAFEPVQANTRFAKDTQRQLLRLVNATRSVTQDQNVFVAPLNLPDGNQLLSMIVSGEDYDVQGEVRVRLLRCQHTAPTCLNLGETSSGVGLTGGLFESTPVFLQNQIVNNALYSYYLELNLTALQNSGLRSVRIETIPADEAQVPPAGNIIRWELVGNFYRFPLPNTTWTQVKICTDDLSHLPNGSHYPYLVVDGGRVSLSSNACETVQGYNIEIRREPNTGSSSGTYQVLR
jgi:hypothetical protein